MLEDVESHGMSEPGAKRVRGSIRWKGIVQAGCVSVSLFACLVKGVTPVWADTVDARAIVQNGTPSGAPGCSACHGEDGGGNGNAGFPRLAGLNSRYLETQLADLAAGARASEIMAPIAKALSAAERTALAQYYGALRPTVPGAPEVDAAVLAGGRKLVMTGDWSRGVPSCLQCHGPVGVGVGATFPAIGGQWASYLVAQLSAWKGGLRNNDPLGLMHAIASKMADSQIEAVSAYLQSIQPISGTRP